MAFIFRMTFTGLCAFVQRSGGAEGSVLLVNTDNLADDLNFHSELHVHEPRVIVQGQPISLKGKVLSYSVINGVMAPDTLQPVEIPLPVPPPTKPSPNTDQARGIYWIANMADVEGGNAHDDCFSGTLPNAKVAARVKLSSGYLSASRMVKSLSGDDLEWNFRKSHEGTVSFVRAMAAEFSVSGIVTGDLVRLAIFDGATGQTAYYDLAPVGGEVSVGVDNSCFCEDKEGPLEDFALFYRLARDRGAIHLPYRFPGGDLSDTLCPPARLAPHPNA